MLASEAKKRLRRNLFAVEHQEIGPENTCALEGQPLFFCLHAGWWLPLSVRAAVFACAICKEILERRQSEWRLATAQARTKLTRLLRGSF